MKHAVRIFLLFCYYLASYFLEGRWPPKFPADARQLQTHSLAANERMLSRVLHRQSLQATRAGDILPNMRGKKWGSSMCLTHLLFISFQLPRKRTWGNFSTSASKRSKDSSCFHRTIAKESPFLCSQLHFFTALSACWSETEKPVTQSVPCWRPAAFGN